QASDGRDLGRGCRSSPAAARDRRQADVSLLTVLRESGRTRGQATRGPDSCNSTSPFFTRLMFVACWWARAIVESTETVKSTLFILAACAVRAEWMTSQVPSPARRRCQVHTVCHLPNVSGKSRQAMPVRYR